MNKNSTPASPTIIRMNPAVAPELIPHPRHTTLNRLRQFARAYSYIPAAGSFGGMVLN